MSNLNLVQKLNFLGFFFHRCKCVCGLSCNNEREKSFVNKTSCKPKT